MLKTRTDMGRHSRPFNGHPTPPGSLLTYSQRWPGVSLLDFFHNAAGKIRLYWENENRPAGFAGYGAAAILTAEGADRFRIVQIKSKRLFRHIIVLKKDIPREAGPKLFGGFSFQFGESGSGIWDRFPDAWFLLPRHQLTRVAGESWLTLNHVLQPGENPEEIAARLRSQAQDMCWQGISENRVSPLAVELGPLPRTVSQEDGLPSNKDWVKMVNQATKRIRNGDLEKVVLARARQLHVRNPISFSEVLARLKARYPECYRFLFEPVPGKAFFGATPELLVETKDKRIRTVALAGSIRRGSTWREDQALGQRLFESRKNRHEHDLVVSTIVKDLSPLVNDLDVAATPALCHLNNIMHLKTPILGHLADGDGILTLVHALHPTPALGGCPREAALPLINELEQFPRGWYGAPVGLLTPEGDGLFAVAIRSAVANGLQATLYSGAGIVADSDPLKEWRETELKFQPILQALGA